MKANCFVELIVVPSKVSYFRHPYNYKSHTRWYAFITCHHQSKGCSILSHSCHIIILHFTQQMSKILGRPVFRRYVITHLEKQLDMTKSRLNYFKKGERSSRRAIMNSFEKKKLEGRVHTT
jgi:hypothetical protein